VLNTLVSKLQDPASFIATTDAAIERLKDNEAELARGLQPILDELAKVGEERKEIERSRIRAILSSDELNQMERDAKERKQLLETRRDALGPDVPGRLERTRDLISHAEDYRKIAEARAESGMTMSEFNFGSQFAESEDVEKLRKSGRVLGSLGGDGDTATRLADILSRLHADIYAFTDYLEVRGVIDFPVPYTDTKRNRTRQASRATRGSG